jgi:hypothetical protein
VEGRQSGHPVAINADAMPYNTDEGCRVGHGLKGIGNYRVVFG